MPKKVNSPASAKDEIKWGIYGSEISTQKEKSKGLEREGNSSEIHNTLVRQGFIEGPNGMTMKVESNTVKKDAKGRIVERRDVNGNILTGKKEETRETR